MAIGASLCPLFPLAGGGVFSASLSLWRGPLTRPHPSLTRLRVREGWGRLLYKREEVKAAAKCNGVVIVTLKKIGRNL